MENKKISNLVVPMTKRTLSLLGAVTIMATGLSGCKGEVKNNTSSDISMTSSVTSEDETLDSSVYEEIDSSNLEISSEVIDDASKDNSEITSNNSSKSNSSGGNKVTSSNSTSSIKNNQTNNSQSSSSPISTPSITPTMPSKLTKDNINDVKVFKEFAKEIALDTRGGFGGIWTYIYNGQQYQILGAPEEEFWYILAGLNINYMNNESLAVIFEGKTLDDIKRYNSIIGLLIVALDNANNQNTWDNLIIDKDILSSMKQIESAYLDYKNNINKDKLRNLLDNQMNCTNPIVRRYFSRACQKLFRTDSYDNYKYNSLSTDLHFETEDEIEQFSIDLFNKIKSKTKVLN